MRSEKLLTPNALRFKLALTSSFTSMLAGLALVAYLSPVVHFTKDQFQFLWIVIAIFMIPLAMTSAWLGENWLANTFAYLAEHRNLDGKKEANQRLAFAEVVDYPRKIYLYNIICFLCGGILIPGEMMLRFPLMNWLVALLMFTAVVIASLLAQAFIYTVLKIILEPLRNELAMDVPDPEERANLVRTVSMPRQLFLALVSISMCMAGYSIFLMHGRNEVALKSLVFKNQRAIVRQILEREQNGVGSNELLEWARNAYGSLGFEFAVFDRKLEIQSWGHEGILHEEEFAWLRSSEMDEGTSLELMSPNYFSWVPLSRDGSILIVVSSGESLGVDYARDAWTIFGILLLALIISLIFSSLASRDLSRSMRQLFEHVNQIASGNLRRQTAFECENELGELSRLVDKMRAYLQQTVQDIMQFSDNTKNVASTVAVATGNIASASLEQLDKISAVRDSVEGLTQRVGMIASSASSLSSDVENSSAAASQLKTVSGGLNNSASELSQRVEEASVSLDEMVANITQVSENAETLSRFIEEVSSSVTEMATQVKEVESSAEETAKLSQHVTIAANVGRERVQEAISGMELIEESTTVAEKAVRHLTDRYAAIGSIVDVIDEVADETNLLALNAAIIAAQAGENGKAFSVVANEIKDLADRVTSNTKEISALIKGLQRESDHAVELIAKGSASVKNGVDLSAEAGSALDQITSAANESGIHIKEIVKGFKEHAQTSRQLVDLIESVRLGVQEIRAAGQEQREGGRLVTRNAAEIDEIAKHVNITAQEQDRGSTQIAESMQRIRVEVGGINNVLQEQNERCRQSTKLLSAMQERAQLSEQSAKETDNAMRELLKKFEHLRSNVQRRFMVG